MNRRIYATDPLSLDGWLAAEGLFLRELGRNEERWLDQTSFMERNAESVIRALKEHPEAVGVIPACQLERLIEHGQVERSDILVLNEMRNDKLACAHSTTAYPGWSFGAVQGVDPKVKKVVTAALFSMSRARYGVEWVLPVSDIPVRTLFEDLKVGPWANYQNFSLERTVREHFELFVSVILCLTMIILYALSISVVVRKRTRLLTQALAERKRIEDEVIKTREHISNLERVGIVGQMSTLIAHELKQPIGAVTNYGNGLLRLLRRGAYDPERFEQIIGEIVAQAGRASEIVDRVRAYAKQDKPPRLRDRISNPCFMIVFPLVGGNSLVEPSGDVCVYLFYQNVCKLVNDSVYHLFVIRSRRRIQRRRYDCFPRRDSPSYPFRGVLDSKRLIQFRPIRAYLDCRFLFQLSACLFCYMGVSFFQ